MNPHFTRLFRRFSRPIMVALGGLGWAATGAAAAAPSTVEQWNGFELALAGPVAGNPFTEVEVSARFTQGERTVQTAGFYDGDGVYKARFMPESTGEWRYATASNRPELRGKTGAFTVTPPTKGNHGPVRVRQTFHFAYADGTPFRQLGTTCYAWTHQGVIDTWNMTIIPVDGVFGLKKRNAFVADKDGRSVAPNDHLVPGDVFGAYFADQDGRSVPLLGRPYIAVRVRRQP